MRTVLVLSSSVILFASMILAEDHGADARLSVPAALEWKDGPYGYWEAGMKHFVWVKGETIVQFHGTGPWTINYLDPMDDPRNSSGKK